MKPLFLGLLLVSLIAGAAVLAWNLLLWRGCVYISAPHSPAASPIKSFVGSGSVPGLELAEVRPPAANTSGTRTFAWEGKTLPLETGDSFFVEKADVDVAVIGTYSLQDAHMPIDEVQQYAVSFEIADADRQRFEAWLAARNGRTIAMLTGGALFSVAQWNSSAGTHSFSCTGPGKTGWTLSEATKIASSLCP